MGIFSLPLTVLWIVGIINAVNLIDGLDGLAGGRRVLRRDDQLRRRLADGTDVGRAPRAPRSRARCWAFSSYNFNPARIFMGDSGSYFLASCWPRPHSSARCRRPRPRSRSLVPLIALGVPIFDTLFAMVRRVLERRPLFSPDRGHIHHRLLDMGITHRRAVLIIYGVSGHVSPWPPSPSRSERSWQVGAAPSSAPARCCSASSVRRLLRVPAPASSARSRASSRDAELLREVLPYVPGMMASANTEDNLRALRLVMNRAELSWIEILVPPDSKGEPSLRWVKDEESESAKGVSPRATPSAAKTLPARP